ncbi:tuberous sclerosis 1 protein hamartin isoform X1 [Lycorma delicatula]|uniref:tuberous sclerosis 1 protein hamartin isoform X1 n=1 Tax=Lycorma delicatula TaxID=130591 RepID=UPI003F50E23D
MDITELFRSLESNQTQAVEDVKKKFHEYLNATKESWLMNGLFDYYLATGSLRVIEVLVGVREPHEKYLFDRLSETLRGASKLQGLTLLGHIVRRNPTWLYKITQHNLIKDLLKLLKVETDMLSVMSALLVVIVLLPMIAGFVAPLLQEIFEVFSRLASWNTNNPNKMSEGYLLHLQVGLYALFHRLYGMFPCNFLAYLRHEYSIRGDNLTVFSHTIKPMLETVKMHPLLVTASKDAETAPVRWKKMEPHDVIVECAKFTVETTSTVVPAVDNKQKDDSSSLYLHHSPSHCSRSSLECAGVIDGSHTSRGVRAFSSQLPTTSDKEIWTPSTYCGGATSPPDLSASAPTSIPHTPISQTFVSSSFLQHEGSSPPEAAVEATPETTPVKDLRQVTRCPPSVGSSVVRALNSTLVGPTGGSSPMHSQPSSPMKKEVSPFRFPPDNCSAFQQLPRNISTCTNSNQYDQIQARRDSFLSQRVQRIVLERIQVSETQSIEGKTLKPKTPVSSGSYHQPTSPLRIIPGNVLDRDLAHHVQTPNSPHLVEETQEDREVETMMRGGNELPTSMTTGSSISRHCDSVLQEFHHHHHHDDDHEEVECYDECQQEIGSPCTSGGLHMPNSQSMRDFARRVNRLRYYSYTCQGSEPPIVMTSTGSSLSEGSSFPADAKVRRAISCPEMKKSVSVLSAGDRLPLDENEEDETHLVPMARIECLDSDGGTSKSDQLSLTVNGHSSGISLTEVTSYHKSRKRLTSNSTQTENALPYEHLFLNVFPSIEQHLTPPPPDSCGTPSLFPNKTSQFSPYEAVEAYIETAVQCYDNKKSKQGTENELKLCKDQLVLLNLQLQFERHRREVHAERNRRLLGKSRNNRALEEYNSALRDQVALLQHDKDSIREELEKHRRDTNKQIQKLQESVEYWQEQSKNLQKACEEAKACCETLQQELKQEREKTASVTKKWNDTKAQLFDTGSELQQALNMLSAGREVREELQTLQREVVIGGELQQRSRDTLTHLARAVHHTNELSLQQAAYLQQVEMLNEQLEARNISYDLLKSRVAELESIIIDKDASLKEQNRLVDEVRTDYVEQLKSAEKKSKELRLINSNLEENIFTLHKEVEILTRLQSQKRKQPKISTSQQINVSSLMSLSLNSPSFNVDGEVPLHNIHGKIEDSDSAEAEAGTPSSTDALH